MYNKYIIRGGYIYGKQTTQDYQGISIKTQLKFQLTAKTNQKEE